MENPQPLHGQSIRALQAEKNSRKRLSRIPPSVSPKPGNPVSSSDSPVQEDSDRSGGDNSDASTAASSPVASTPPRKKRVSPSMTPKRRYQVKRLRQEAEQHELDTVRRLEAQVELINQRIADAIAQRNQENPSTQAMPLIHPSLQQSPVTLPPPKPGGQDEGPNLANPLESPTEKIERLSAELKSAMAELRAIAHDVKQRPSTDAALPNVRDPVTEVSQAQWEAAASTAQTLRQLQTGRDPHDPIVRRKPSGANGSTPRANASSSTGRSPSSNAAQSRSLSASSPFKRMVRTGLSWLQLPRTPVAIVVDAIAWVASAAVLRVGLKVLLTAFPSLWLPALLLMVAPAIVAAYLAIFVPQSSFVPGYRFLLLLLGFLAGGRF